MSSQQSYTHYGTNFLESELFLAATEGDEETIEHILLRMSPGLRMKVANDAKWMRRFILGWISEHGDQPAMEV